MSTPGPTGTGANEPGPGGSGAGGANPYGSYGASPGYGSSPSYGSYGSSPAAGGPYGGAPTPPAGGGAPVCPRHPDRVSYVRCQRCGRPVCPECQRTATVGVHCVDCAREAAKTQRQPRTVFGGKARGGDPVVTITIIVICTVIEALRYIAPGLYQSLVVELMFAPAYGLVEPYRFLTSTFLHGSIMHLAFNMYALYLVGGQLERLLGRSRYLALYVLSAIGGSVGYLAIAGVDAGGVVGASGGVFGLFAAYAVFIRRLGGDNRQILVVIAINMVIGFVFSGIAWQAHVGGMVVGAVVALIFARIPVNRRVGAAPGGTGSGGVSGGTLQWLACGAVVIAMVAVVWLVYAVSS